MQLTTTPSGILAPTETQSMDLLDAFVRGKKPATVRAYQADLRDFQGWCGAETPAAAAHALLGHGSARGHDLALEWLEHLASTGMSPNTVNRKLASLKALVKAAAERDLVAWRLSTPRVAVELVRDTRGPGAEVFARMLELAAGQEHPFFATRDFCILRMLHDMGLRQGELRSLRLEDVDLERRKVAVLAKGRQQRTLLTLPEKTREAALAWLQERGTEPGPFITSNRGKALQASVVLGIVSSLSTAAGQRTTPHGLRHLAITRVAEITKGDITRIAAFSRHTDVRMVQVYVDQWRDVQGELANELAESA